MGNVPIHFLVDGIDRLGKSSLINRIQQELGYYLVIHYDKPKVLENSLNLARLIISADPKELDPEYAKLQGIPEENLARRLYQGETNLNMFELLKTRIPMIMDRTHLGEMVYAPLYRCYSGEYVYEYERDLLETKPFTANSDLRLILLTTSNFEMLEDDGLSFNFENKQQEQARFIQAFERSAIPNKVIVDVHNGSGGYKSFEEVFQEAVYGASTK